MKSRWDKKDGAGRHVRPGQLDDTLPLDVAVRRVGKKSVENSHPRMIVARKPEMHFSSGIMSDPKNLRREGMSEKEQANRAAFLEALKAHGCIAGYTVVGDTAIPEWNEGGISRAVKELPNPKPFGLKKSQRSWLLLLLPMEEQEKIHARFIRPMEGPSNLCHSV